MLEHKFIVKSTIDIYITDTEDTDKILLTFHKMTTRERIEIITHRKVAEFFALLDGKHSFSDIQKKLGNFEIFQLENLIKFLLDRRLIIEAKDSFIEIENKYSRQIAFFDDLFLDRNGFETQLILEKKHIVFLGCGAVTGAIAESLVRAGIGKVTLVDGKEVDKSSLDRHLYLRESDLGQDKVLALASYLKRINPDLNVTTYKAMLLPKSDLSAWINDDVDLVINGCDEPYIGHTSLKIGRYLAQRSVPLYVMGGFDAHLMSSGELIFPPYTPCIDCAQKTFNLALKDWTPTYSQTQEIEQLVTQSQKMQFSEELLHKYIGNSAGLAMMSSFSAHLSVIRIIHFLVEDSSFVFHTERYEYLPNSGELTAFLIEKQGGCGVCGQ